MKRVVPCEPATAHRHTGYLVGGTSPVGTLKSLPVYAQATIFSLPRLLINGGKRGFLVEIEPLVLREVLQITEVDVCLPLGSRSG